VTCARTYRRIPRCRRAAADRCLPSRAAAARQPLSDLPRRLARVSDIEASTQQRGSLMAPIDRVRLEALRYAVNEESVQYIAVMRTFTGGLSGLLSDQSAAEVAAALADEGIELDTDTTDARLSYLVEHGNLARSPRETEARSLRDYLQNRARYQLTQRGELVHRQIEDLLAYSESAREVSSEMLGGIQAGLAALDGYDDAALAAAEPDLIAREIGTLFAQFERLVHSTREFYTYLTQVLSRFDLDRGEFQAFKTALLDYLQRFVDEISRYMPQIADVLGRLAPRVPMLCDRANAGQRLLDLQGQVARRSPGLSPEDWHGLHVWFNGEGGRGSDADGCAGWPVKLCVRCWSTCAESPPAARESTAGMSTWCVWRAGLTPRMIPRHTPCGRPPSACIPVVTWDSSPTTTAAPCHQRPRGGWPRSPTYR
jgi:hypothetical protein